MPEKIGLAAELDLTQWDLAVSRYLESIEKMNDAANGIAGSVGSGFAGLDLSLSGIASGITSTFMGIGEAVISSLIQLAQDLYVAYQDLGRNLLTITTTAVAAIVGAIGLAGKTLIDWTVDGIKANTDFEQSLADIASVLRITREEVTPLGEEIDKLALDPQLVVSTEQASSVIEQLARNGLSMTEILNGAANASILLANATGSNDPQSFASSADIATMAMQMFNLKAEEFNRIADVSQGVINNSRIELSDWALALGNGGAAAGALNVTLEDFATGIAGTVNLYHTARQAGTGLTNFLERLVPLSETASDEMTKLGLFSGLTGKQFDKLAGDISNTQNKINALDPTSKNYQANLEKLTKTLQEQRSELNAGKNAFFDQQGNLKSLADVSEILRNATKDLSDEQKIEAYRTIFGNDALETAIGFSNLGAEAFTKLKDSLAISGSAAEAAATRTKTLAARWENLGDIWTAIQRKSGAGFNDMLLKLVNRLTELTNANQDRIIKFFGELANVLSEAVDAAMPWIERMLPILLDNLEALAYWLLYSVKDGNVFNEWLDRMSPGLKNFIESIINIVIEGKKFIVWLVDTGKAIYQALEPYIEWIKQNITLKDALIAAAGAIAVYVLPGILRMVSIAVLAVKAVSAIRQAWETDWLGIRTFFEAVWPKIQQPLTDFVNNFLTGDWVAAWENAKEIVGTVIATIIDLLDDLHTPITDFIILILQGEWQDAWLVAVNWVITKLEEMKKNFYGWASDLVSILENILTGDWQAAWENTKKFISDVFTFIVETIRGLDTPITTFIADVLEGKWVAAWNDAKQIVLDAKNSITQWLLDLHQPFTDFIALVLQGEWQDAWTVASSWVIAKLEEIKAYVPLWAADWISVVQTLLTGDWSTAWINAKQAVLDTLTAITEGIRGLNTPFTDFVADVLEGNFGKAWEEFKNLVGLTDDKISLVVTGIQVLGAVMGVMALGGLASVVSGFASWLTELVSVSVTIAPFITTLGLLAAAYYLLITPTDKIIAGLEVFQDRVLDLVNNTQYPIWLRSIFAASVAGAAAIEEWTRVLGLWKITADASFGAEGAGKKYPDALTQLGNDVRQIGEFLEMAGLEAEFFTLKFQMLLDALKGQGEDANKSNRLKEIQDRIGLLKDTLKEELFGLGTINIPSVKPGEVPDNFLTRMFNFDAATAQRNLDEITAKMDQLHNQLDIHYLSLQELAKLTGQNSVQDFAKAFVGSDSQDAQTNVLIFSNKIAEVAASIKQGFYSAGDKSVGLYVQALAEKSGLAEDQAFKLAQVIVNTFGSNLTDVGGLIVPQAYQETVIDPLTGLAVPANSAGQNVGQESMQGVEQGVSDGSGSLFDTIQKAIDGAIGVYDTLVPASKTTGQQSVENLGAGVSENQQPTIDTFGNLATQAQTQVDTLIDQMTKTGQTSVSNMGTGAESATPNTIGLYQMLADGSIAKVDPVTEALMRTGQESVTGLGTEAEKATPIATGAFDSLSTEIVEAFKTNIDALLVYISTGFQELGPTVNNQTDVGPYVTLAERIGVSFRDKVNEYLMIVIKNFINLSSNANSSTSASDIGFIQTLAERIGVAFRDKINEYLMIVINNFANLASNIGSQIDVNKFTELGNNIGNALKTGLDSQLAAVQASGAALVTAAQVGVTTTAEIASPSKLFGRLAGYIGQGFINSLKSSFVEVTDITKTMVDSIAAMTTGAGTISVGASAGKLPNIYDQINSNLNQQLGQRISSAFPTGSVSSNYSNISSPINITNNIYNQMDQAQLEYMMQKTLNGARLS